MTLHGRGSCSTWAKASRERHRRVHANCAQFPVRIANDLNADTDEIRRAPGLPPVIKTAVDGGRSPECAPCIRGIGIETRRIVLPNCGARLFFMWNGRRMA